MAQLVKNPPPGPPPAGTPLRVALADRDADALRVLGRMLAAYGHEVVVSCRDAADLVRGCREHRPDLVVIEMEMAEPGCGGLAELVCRVCDGRDIPVIAVSTSCTKEYLEGARTRSCMAHLVKPLTEQTLVATVSLSVYHFEILAAVCRELADLRNSLESRKTVERAKGVLMGRAGMSEAQAHARLQELASSRGMKVAAVADLIVEAELAFSKMIS